MNKVSLLLAAILMLTQCTKSKYQTVTKKDKNGYVYEETTNDPFGVRVYTLKNGLKVYLSVNKDEPRIQTFIAVKAGSSYDPEETTGLAHYLEHMMFKGSNEIGALDWEKEKAYLDEISNLFEQHKAATDPQEKKAIYHKIDSVSQLASKLVAANEYDKLIKFIGGKNTNAYTSTERVVFMNNIPSNELERWLKIERSRFKELALRLFHTELETVYEEFNMGQDNDERQAYYKFMELLFPNHVYGTQTTIGKPEHLKNPSMVNIQNYFKKYYVPNNMAFCMSGDLDFEETIQKIDQYFGDFERSLVEPVKNKPADPIVGVKTAEVFGPKSEFVYVGYRFAGNKSEDEKYVTLISEILSNGKAGLMDLDLNQAQKVLQSGASTSFMKQYGFLMLYGYPKQDQTLEDVKTLMIEEIEKIKKGEFEDWMIQAAINNVKLQMLQMLESNNRAHLFVGAFTEGMDWSEQLAYYDELATITKKQLVAFANKHFGENYIVMYKRTGKNENAVKVEKPKITPIQIDRTRQSEFATQLMSIETKRIDPVFVDFKTAIQTQTLKDGISLSYIKNNVTPLFTLYYIIPMGKLNSNKLEIAVNYLQYLGTDKYTPAQLQQELFKNGLTFGVFTSDDESRIYMSGLEENLPVAVDLLEHILHNVVPDETIYADYVKGVIRSRMNAKKDKNQILWEGLLNYGKYGAISPATDIISNKELAEINPTELTDLIKSLYKYPHEIFYYGQKEMSEVAQLIGTKHQMPDEFLAIPTKKEYPERNIDKNEVYLTNWDMVQANVLLIAKAEKNNIADYPAIRLFGEFYGSGLSSIVFQEMREARALAYTAWAQYSIPVTNNESHYVLAFVGTQPDKIKIATDAMLDLMSNMPQAERQFNGAKDAILRQIETSRTVRENIFWTYRRNLKRGIDYDINREIYSEVQKIDLNQFSNFFNNKIAGKKFAFMVLGPKAAIDMKILAKIGPVKELSVDQLFPY
ncbi:MAG TPA: insulinase family protein [Salinivirgaceae bacterium]|nr:insulinase family protein [Salinivirgaceae bacterium]